MLKKQKLLQELYTPHNNFKSSPLYIEKSQNIIFGEGDPDADIMFIGEAPGKNEELEGRPFVGRSGQLLDHILEQAKIKRSNVYITNIVKCRPPNNRTPSNRELEIGRATILLEQIAIIKPRIICTLGATALKGLTLTPYQITKIHGKTLDFNGIILIPTYHPAYILRCKSKTAEFLADIQKIAQL